MRYLYLAPVVAALVVTGCEASADRPLAPEVGSQRSADPNQDGVIDLTDFVLWKSSFPGNGNLQIHAGTATGAASGGVVLFEFANGSIIGRTTPPSGTPGDDDVVLDVIARTVDFQILAPGGNLLCEADFGEGNRTFQLRDAAGEVLFTLLPGLVFDGDVIIPRTGHEFHRLVADRLFLSYNHFGIHEGWWPRGPILATATENVQLASPMRQIVIAAMLAGRCGSLGIQ